MSHDDLQNLLRELGNLQLEEQRVLREINLVVDQQNAAVDEPVIVEVPAVAAAVIDDEPDAEETDTDFHTGAVQPGVYEIGQHIYITSRRINYTRPHQVTLADRAAIVTDISSDRRRIFFRTYNGHSTYRWTDSIRHLRFEEHILAQRLRRR